MSVEVNYGGRTGNKMFQYAFGRIMATLNGLQLLTEWAEPEFIRATPIPIGRINTSSEVTLYDSNVPEHGIPHHLEDYRNNKIIIHGYYQDISYYEYDERITRSIWDLDPVDKRPPNEIVLHLRVGDYLDSGLRSVISPNWHDRILSMINYNPKRMKLYIVVADTSERILGNYTKHRPEIVSQSAKEDFDFIRSFDTIISSNSSFSWWAAFLSNASKIYTFAPWLRFPEHENLNLAHMRRAIPLKGGYYK